ncbi:MAG TPA: methyltransferase [Streptosporangiaceae bacterium]
MLPGLHLGLETDAGVFSAGRLDPGTRLLLDTVPAPPPSGDLVDLGCGYGPIALVLAARAPQATVWAIDVNERALGLCARNAARAGLRNVRCATPEDAALPAAVTAIWSNPPIRIGKQPLHALLAGWLARLAPGGRAHLVVQRHLGADSLHAWLEQQGWPVTRVAAKSGYRILRAEARAEPNDAQAQDPQEHDA